MRNDGDEKNELVKLARPHSLHLAAKREDDAQLFFDSDHVLTQM